MSSFGADAPTRTFSRERNNFLMGFENSYLSEWGNNPLPIGFTRYQDPEWAKMMKRACNNHSDVSLAECCEWVEQGGGDGWFSKCDAAIIDLCEADEEGSLITMD